MAGDEVGVEVGLGGEGDSEAVSLRRFQVGSGVAAGVDDERAALTEVDHVRGVAEALIDKSVDPGHGSSSASGLGGASIPDTSVIVKEVVEVDGREAKDALYEQFARLGRAVANPKRIELLDLLAQGERSVEALGEGTGMGLTNTSNHLQVLRQARLVATRKEGTRVLYRLADDEVLLFAVALRSLARTRLAEVDRVVRDYFVARDSLETVSRDELIDRASRGDVIVLDVRPREEFVQGHIPGAISVPLGELEQQLRRMRKRVEIVAYCRGPYCVLAPEAVELLRRHGFRARRLEDGMPEWRLAGLPVAVGLE